MVVWHDSASGWPSNQWAQGGQSLDLAVLLKISEGSRRLSPTIEAKDRVADSRHRLQQRLIEGHIER
jgi:hypothetical protein